MRAVKDRFRIQHSRVIFLIKLIDTFIVSFSLYLLINIIYQDKNSILLFLPILLTILFFWYFSEISRLYLSWRATSLKEELIKIIKFWLFTFCGTIFFIFFFNIFLEYRRIFFISCLLFPLFQLLV